MTQSQSYAVRRRPEQERSKKRVAAILDAAKLLIAERGIEPFSMTQVASEAGMGLTALYRYFPNKAAVLHELSSQMLEEDKSGFIMASQNLQGTVDQFIRFTSRIYVDLYQQEPYRIPLRTAIQSNIALLNLDMEDTQANAKFFAKKLSDLAHVQELASLKSFAVLYQSLLNSTIQLMACMKDEEEAEEALESFMKMSVRQVHAIIDEEGQPF